MGENDRQAMLRMVDLTREHFFIEVERAALTEPGNVPNQPAENFLEEDGQFQLGFD